MLLRGHRGKHQGQLEGRRIKREVWVEVFIVGRNEWG